MKILVTGANGQLGWDVILELKRRSHEPIATDIIDNYEQDCDYINLDITDRDAVHDVVTKVQPDAVIHCAAWTAVDAAEDEENKSKVQAINVSATSYIAEACKEINSKMIYISTDYVFNGEGDTPWNPDCEEFEPLNFYGETKLGGERSVKNILKKYFIVRTSWVFGSHGNNFVKTMLNLADKHTELRIVNDQIGTPTYTPDLARLLVDMCESEKYGVYHASNEGGYISWAEFAEEIFRISGKDTKVVPVTTEEYGVSKAKRPKNSRLDKSKLKISSLGALPDWRNGLKRYIDDFMRVDKIKKKISVIIPTLNAEESISKLLESLILQSIKPDEIIIVDSESEDKTVEIAKSFPKVKVINIKRKDFNHGGTRDMSLNQSIGDIVVFMTQDAIPENNILIEKLIAPFEDDDRIAVSTARQIPRENATPAEKLIREYNYPAESSIRNAKDIAELGIKAFYISDVCAAYCRSIYLDVGGFEGDLKTNEDMLFAAKAIQKGYSVCYSADAKVIHSHNFTLREQYKRNYLQGIEIERHKKLLNVESINGEGFNMIKYVSSRLLKKGKIFSFIRFGFDCVARLFGNRAGRRHINA